MKLVTRSFLALALGSAVLFGSEAHAALTCSGVGGMALTSQVDSTAVSGSDCAVVGGGYNYAFDSYGTVGLSISAFLAKLPSTWGSDWVYLGEADNRGNSSSAPLAFGYQWSNWAVPIGSQNSNKGTFSVNIAADPAGPFAGQTLDLVGVMKPNSRSNPGVPGSGPGDYPDAVFAYLFGGFQITKEGALSGTFDFRPDGDAFWSGVALFGRLSATSTDGTVPEPGVLGLLGTLLIASSLVRRRHRQ